MSLILHAVEAVQHAWSSFVPNAVEVFNYDLGVRVTEAQLEEMARRFTERHRREYMDSFKVHDACHYLLDAPPTPMGEGLVVRFQVRNMIYDAEPFGGGLGVVVAGWIIRGNKIVRSFDRRIGELQGDFQRKIDQLDAPTAGLLQEGT